MEKKWNLNKTYAGLCNEIKPLKEIIDDLFKDYKEAYLALEKEV